MVSQLRKPATPNGQRLCALVCPPIVDSKVGTHQSDTLATTPPEGCTLMGGVGTSAGDALSNDNALYIGLRQTYTDAKHNGGFYISGQSQSIQENSKWTSTYLDGAVKSFTDTLDDTFSALYPATGTWRLVIISKTMMPWLEPLGTVMNVTGAAANNRVMTQSRRRQKVRGFS